MKSILPLLQELALSRGCEAIELNCCLQNEESCKFWESNGYKELGMHYQKKFNP